LLHLPVAAERTLRVPEQLPLLLMVSTNLLTM
jgi:hypothetical protein